MLPVTPADRAAVNITGPAGIGEISLWVPEAIGTRLGGAAVYPLGGPWVQEDGRLVQHVTQEDSIGPGNCPKIDAETFECCGIRYPHNGHVEWQTTVIPADSSVEFSIRLKNVGDTVIEKASAAVCVRFSDGQWWRDESVFVRAGGAVRSLAELGRDAGLPNGFQAYPLTGQLVEHPFYIQFWGVNRNHLDWPVMVSENPEAGLCVAVEAPRAYFLHSNPGNPCTDLSVAFGDVAPGGEAEAGGRVSIHQRKAAEVLA